MAVQVHVEGQVTAGCMPDFTEAVQRYRTYAAEHGYAVPEVLLGLSGPMNTIRLVFGYDELSQYEDHELRAMTDRDYGKVAGEMEFAGGTVTYTIFHTV